MRIVRSVMKYIFIIIYLFDELDVNIFSINLSKLKSYFDLE